MGNKTTVDSEMVCYAVHTGIDDIFSAVHKKHQTKSGDITPTQEYELSLIKKNLSKLIVEQLKQNL